MNTQDHPYDGRAKRLLLEVALPIVYDIRNDLDAAHRVIAYLDRSDLEAVVCILAAYFADGTPLGSREWWNDDADTPERVAERRRVLTEALAPRRRSA